MRKSTLLIISFILLWCFGLQAQTKAGFVLNDWFEVASDTVAESVEIDVSGMFAISLHIQHALTTDAVEQARGEFLIQVASETGTSDEDWQTLFPISMVTGIPNTQALAGSESAGDVLIEISSTTGRYTNDGVRPMLLKDNTLALSEIVWVHDAVTDVSITIQDGLTNAHTSADILWDIAASRSYYVDVYEQDRLRIFVDNTLDNGGPQVTCRISYIEITEN